VLRLDRIRDVDTMRQVAVLLERENDRLHAKLTTLTRELSQLRGEDASAAQRQLEALKEILAHREHALFGASSEKRPQPATAPPAPAAPPPRGHGPKAQPALPIIEIVHELAASDRTCTACGGVLREMTGQTEDSEEITVVERHFVMLHHLRKKYRCTCNGCVETAPGPLRLTTRPDRRGRRYSADFAVEVAIGKYLDHLPLERQVRMMRREGLALDSQTLWDQLEAAATILRPTYEALRQHVQTAPVIGADETWWRVCVGPAGKR
jgi:transposase